MLYIVPTPVGNLEDITLRAINILSKVEVIICEDSRKTRELLRLLNINNKPKFVDYMKNHNINLSKIEEVLEFEDKDIAFVTDAGTPGISDPGILLIRLLQQKKIEYTVLPGATALIPAVVASGLVTKDFVFVGFLPTKKGRQSAWQMIVDSQIPVVLYESVHRISKMIEEAQIYLSPTRKVCICKELSKKFEEVRILQVNELSKLEMNFKGEFVVVIDKKDN